MFHKTKVEIYGIKDSYARILPARGGDTSKSYFVYITSISINPYFLYNKEAMNKTFTIRSSPYIYLLSFYPYKIPLKALIQSRLKLSEPYFSDPFHSFLQVLPMRNNIQDPFHKYPQYPVETAALWCCCL